MANEQTRVRAAGDFAGRALGAASASTWESAVNSFETSAVVVGWSAGDGEIVRAYAKFPERMSVSNAVHGLAFLEALPARRPG